MTISETDPADQHGEQRAPSITPPPAAGGQGEFCWHCRKPLPVGPQPHHVVMRGKTFFTNYCSDACREARFRETIKESEAQRRSMDPTLKNAGPLSIDQAIENYRVAVKQINGRKIHAFLCESCGNIILHDDGRKRRFCSSKCRDTYHNARRPGEQNNPAASAKCEHCGATLTARAGAKYCSDRCRKAASRARRKEEK